MVPSTSSRLLIQDSSIFLGGFPVTFAPFVLLMYLLHLSKEHTNKHNSYVNTLSTIQYCYWVFLSNQNAWRRLYVPSCCNCMKNIYERERQTK